MLTDDQHDKLRKHVMNVNDKAEWKRETTHEGVKGRMKELVTAAKELVEFGEGTVKDLEKDG